MLLKLLTFFFLIRLQSEGTSHLLLLSPPTPGLCAHLSPTATTKAQPVTAAPFLPAGCPRAVHTLPRVCSCSSCALPAIPRIAPCVTTCAACGSAKGSRRCRLWSQTYLQSVQRLAKLLIAASTSVRRPPGPAERRTVPRAVPAAPPRHGPAGPP